MNKIINVFFTVLILLVTICNAAYSEEQTPDSIPKPQIGYYQCWLGLATSKNSSFNAIKAAEYLNGTIVQPGQICSYNRVVGERTEERGFISGPYMVSSGKPKSTIGGGICMTAGVLHQAVKSAPGLTPMERHNHVRPTKYLPLGQDAAIWWEIEDYKFRNDTDKPVIIVAGAMNNYLYIKIEKN